MSNDETESELDHWREVALTAEARVVELEYERDNLLHDRNMVLADLNKLRSVTKRGLSDLHMLCKEADQLVEEWNRFHGGILNPSSSMFTELKCTIHRKFKSIYDMWLDRVEAVKP